MNTSIRSIPSLVAVTMLFCCSNPMQVIGTKWDQPGKVDCLKELVPSLKTRQHFFLNIQNNISGMVLHSLFSTSFSTFNSLPASSSQRASRLSWLFRLFQLFAASPQVCSAVACFFFTEFLCSEFLLSCCLFFFTECLCSEFLLSCCLFFCGVYVFRILGLWILFLGKVFSTRELATFFFLWSTFHDHHLFYLNPSYHSYPFYSHLIWLQPSLTRARSFSVFFSASFTLIITIISGNNVKNPLASNDPHVILHRHLLCSLHFCFSTK